MVAGRHVVFLDEIQRIVFRLMLSSCVSECMCVCVCVCVSICVFVYAAFVDLSKGFEIETFVFLNCAE